ncbi:hypothetical protein C359_00518 [Cryptococcus neoformans Bt120]|nr:hypothetical protein C359_00518 [Cryptococcus neoformans var. grubii Bt120]
MPYPRPSHTIQLVIPHLLTDSQFEMLKDLTFMHFEGTLEAWPISLKIITELTNLSLFLLPIPIPILIPIPFTHLTLHHPKTNRPQKKNSSRGEKKRRNQKRPGLASPHLKNGIQRAKRL